MVPKKLVERVYNRVKKMITDENSGHLDTGIFGTKYLSLLLSDNGDMDLLLDTYFIPTYPSFGYQFSKNATTLWEQWSDTKGDMLSFNHAMFAGAGAFIPKGVLGIQVENIRKVKIKPSMSSKINFAKGCYPTLLGDYKIDWHIKKGCFYLTLEIPFNCEAELTLPDKSIYNLKAGRHSLSCKLEEESGVVIKILKSDVVSGSMLAGEMASLSGGSTVGSSGLQELLTNVGLNSKITEVFVSISNNLFDLMWQTGIQMIIFLAGLQTIPPALYEAADTEGASAWEKFWMITLPMLTPIMLVNIVYTVVDSFTSLENAVISQINSQIQGLQFGVSSAMSIPFVLIIFVILALVLAIFKKIDNAGNTRQGGKK